MTSMDRRRFIVGTTATAITLSTVKAQAADTTGITSTEIRIGSTSPQSGPVSAYGVQARCQAAYFKMINDRGGIAGRKINFIYYDDAFNPAKTVEQTRRLVENDEVAILFSSLGTATNSAIVKYVNAKKVPHLFLSVNGDRWSDYKTHPWSMGFAPSARTEAAIFVKHMLAEKPDAKFAVLYQNDDFGKDFVLGAKDALGDRESKIDDDFPRNLRSDDRLANSPASCLRTGRPDLRYDCQVHRTGNPKSRRDRLEDAPLHHQRLIVLRRNDQPCRPRECRGSDLIGLPQGCRRP